jgi:hypothetical protein
MMKSTWMRWAVCTVAVLAMLALLGGCAKKESGEATETTETTETATETTAPAAAGTYTASMANGTASLMLNNDMSASFSLQATPEAPAQVENGNWAASGTGVDVTFSKMVADSTMSVTLNFAASGDTLALTNGDTVGMPGLKLMKQHAEGDGHQH